MRIALIAPVWFPVPPERYGGTERVVSLLADGLVEAGHDVTLFASGDSQTEAALDSVFETAPSERIGQTWWELQHAVHALGRAGEFDVVNDHTGLLGLALGGLVTVPFVHTVHGPLDGGPGEMYAEICRLVPRARLISISQSQRAPRPRLPWVATCHNALDLSLYPFRPGDRAARRRDYLVFLGRMSPDKGAHRAIAIARKADVPLKIAAKCRERAEQEYFEQFVRPHLGGGVEYVGEVGHGDKVELLSGARALLFPIAWEEPFGLVMVEAMACGTPVIATRRGSVPEVVEHGRSGIVVDDYRDMPAALEQADRLDPAQIRAVAEERFSPERMVADYLAAYGAVVAEHEVLGAAETAARTARTATETAEAAARAAAAATLAAEAATRSAEQASRAVDGGDAVTTR
ncbi:MAG TPA: glycosyltransferase family 4 protein [Gaiellaceae bacterium]|nr:glycosyltransferase family 4 protein [Gaiellaceae bacterium]